MENFASFRVRRIHFASELSRRIQSCSSWINRNRTLFGQGRVLSANKTARPSPRSFVPSSVVVLTLNAFGLFASKARPIRQSGWRGLGRQRCFERSASSPRTPCWKGTHEGSRAQTYWSKHWSAMAPLSQVSRTSEPWGSVPQAAKTFLRHGSEGGLPSAVTLISSRTPILALATNVSAADGSTSFWHVLLPR